MDYNYRLKQLTFFGGPSAGSPATLLNLPNLTILVGPNSGGKSQTLRDIVTLTASNRGAEGGVTLGQAVTTLPRSAAELATRYDLRPAPHSGHQQVLRYIGVDLAEGGATVLQSHLKWPEDYDRIVKTPDQFASLFGSSLTAYLRTENRLSLVNKKPAGDSNAEYANLPLAIYRKGTEIERRIRRTVSAAFPGIEIALDFSDLYQIGFRVGKGLASISGDPRDTSPELKKAAWLDDQGDGLRSYLAVVAVLTALERPVVLLDEPEVFLHPSQAFKLGRFIAQQASDSCQIIVATHSAELLRGIILEPSAPLVIRLERVEERSFVRPLDSASLKEILTDPLLSGSGVLAGIFSTAVLVTEGDSDSRFYQTLLRKLKPALDVHVINADNKQTIPKVMKMYHRLGIRCVGVVDIDVVNDPTQLRQALETLEVDPEQSKKAVDACRKICKEVAGNPSARLSSLLEGLSNTLNQFPSVAERTNPDDLNAQIDAIRASLRDLRDDASCWKEAKMKGRDALTECRADFEGLITTLGTARLIVNPFGELESTLVELGIPWRKKKREWLGDALGKLDSMDSTACPNLREFAQQILTTLELPA